MFFNKINLYNISNFIAHECSRYYYYIQHKTYIPVIINMIDQLVIWREGMSYISSNSI